MWAQSGQQATHLGYLVALAAISLVSRLPQLLSPNLLVDGDEAVLGLMAKHVAQGKEFPIFFYGQHYGLSSVEAAAGALGFVVFGTGAVPLKLAMLALWTLGVLFLFLAQSRLLGASRSFWITVVFLLNPAWAVWSMKARGGYITSFTATAALLWLLVRGRGSARRAVRWLVAGAADRRHLSGAAALAARRAADPGRGSRVASPAGRWARGYLFVTAVAILLVSSRPRTWRRGAAPHSAIPICRIAASASRNKST